MRPAYFDIHSHVSFPEYDADRAEVLARVKERNIWTITVGCDRESSQRAVDSLDLYAGMFASIGQHPADNRAEEFDADFYRRLLANKRVVAVGECGIDYFRIKSEEVRLKEKVRQIDLFKKQIELALEFDKPLMIHGRPSPRTVDAYEDILEVLESYKGTNSSKLRGDVHFFAGNLAIANRFIELGFTLSFTGVITFTSDYDEVIKGIPLSSMLSETDCPYVTPTPYRGTRNEPMFVEEVVKRITQLKGESFETVKDAMVSNALQVFGIVGI